MKINKINILYLLLFASLTFACEEEEEPFAGPYTVEIAGAGSAAPASVETYTIGDYLNPGSYTWTVDGPAKIVGEASGATVDVQFNSIGEVTLTVTNGTDGGYLNVEVDAVEPAVTAELKGSGVLKSGASDTVFLTFDAPLVNAPGIVLNTDTSGFAEDTPAFQSGSLGELKKVSDTEYYIIYTAGTGNGTPEALLSGLQTTDAFGGLKYDSLGYAYVHLYEVDNIAPVAELSYSDELVNDSTVVTITATFSEPVTFSSDSAIFVSLSGADVAMPADDTLRATSDPLVYTYEFTVNGEGNGAVTVDILNAADLGGNDVATISNAGNLMVDNTVPVITGTALDAGEYVTIGITSLDAGMGWYHVLAATATAPASVTEFQETEGVASGSMALGESKSVALAPGTYTVYYLGQDGAGNYSTIGSSPLTVTE